MDFDMPSPSQFPSSSQWARACTRPASADTNDGGIVRWMASQSTDPFFQELMGTSAREEEHDRGSCSTVSAYSSTWTPNTGATRTASLPTFSASSTTLPSRSSDPTTSASASTSRRNLPLRKPMSKKVPPSRAYSATARTKDDISLDLDKTAELVELIGTATRMADWHSRLKQNLNEKLEKKAASGSSANPAARKNNVSTSSSGSRFTYAASTAGPAPKTATSTIPRVSASASSQRRTIGKTLSPTTIEPAIKLSKSGDTGADVEMTMDSDRDTDIEGSTFTDSPASLTVTDTMNESFSMHVDDIAPPPTKRTLGRMHSVGSVATRPTVPASNSRLASSSKPVTCSLSTATVSVGKISQTTHGRPPVLTSTQRHPPPLGMRRPPSLHNTGLPSSQSRYAVTQSSYATSQAKGQKQVALPPFKPPLLSKPNSKSVYTLKQSAQNPESPPTSTPELDMDDVDSEHEGGAAAVADSSFDVSFDVDLDALEATMQQYD